MPEIKEVKGRKEYVCSKCKGSIPKGEVHLVGMASFIKPVRRHIACGLKEWEITSSEYLREIGSLQDGWKEDFGKDESAFEGIKSILETLMEETQQRLDNMPEGLQEGPTGAQLQDRIDGIESTIYEIDNIDVNELKAQAVDMSYEFEEDDDEPDENGLPLYDQILADTSGDYDEEGKANLIENYAYCVELAIEDAFTNLAE